MITTPCPIDKTGNHLLITRIILKIHLDTVESTHKGKEEGRLATKSMHKDKQMLTDNILGSKHKVNRIFGNNFMNNRKRIDKDSLMK